MPDHLASHAPSSSSCLSAIGTNKASAELFDAKTLDQVLCFCRDHEISESSAGGLIYARSVGRIHFHHGIDVEQRAIALNENGQCRPAP